MFEFETTITRVTGGGKIFKEASAELFLKGQWLVRIFLVQISTNV